MDENNIYESEVTPKEIIKKMKLNIYNNYNNNSFLNINIDYILNRSSLFSLIHKISNYIGFKSQTYFLSTYYLDIIFSQNKNLQINLDLKILSLACLLLAAKFVENDQNVPNLPSFVTVFNSVLRSRQGVRYCGGGRGFISEKELVFAEVYTCKLLKYKLNYFSVYDFDSFFFGHGIIKIEQLKELSNDINNNDLNGANLDLNQNSIYIRKILEKIYRKSRYYLDVIINNANICLRYSSLIISVAIMKKSVEEILIKEQKVKEYDLVKFKEKASKCFKEIMQDLYQIDYESMDDYKNLIIDSELNKIFETKVYNNINLNIYNTNYKRLKDKDNIENINNNRYKNILNKSINGNNLFFKKLNHVNKLNINKSLIDAEESGFYNSHVYKKERISVPKRYNITKKYTDLSYFNSTFSNNFNFSKNNHLVKHRDRSRVISTNKYPEINNMNNLNNYMHTFTTDFYTKKRNNIINVKNINIDDSIAQTKEINLTRDNINNTEVVSKLDNKERNFDKYKKLILRKKIFNGVNLHNKNRDYSISQIDNSNIFEDTKPKPYFKKVIKNITTYANKSNINNSFFNTINNNMYARKNRIIKITPNTLDEHEIEKEKEINSNNKEKEQENKHINIIDENNNDNNNSKTKNIFNIKNNMLNHRKKIYSNNILNGMAMDNNNININNFTTTNKDSNDEEISFTSNDYINKKKERQKLLFDRMKNINNKISFQNKLNKLSVRDSDNLNNLKEKIYDNQIIIQTGNNKIKVNKNFNYVIKDPKYKSIRYKYLSKKNSEDIKLNIEETNNNTNINKEIKKEKTDYPNSSIYKLINKTKTLNENKIDLSKEEIDLDLVHNFNKYLFNKNKNSKILKNAQTLQLNNTNTEINNTNHVFNTLENNNNNEKASPNNNNENKNIIHGYHYRNYMKNRIKKKKETDNNNNKIKDKINDNSKMIVINNNININFNNKIEHSSYQRNNKDNGSIQRQNTNTNKINENKKIYNELTYDHNKYNTRGTIDCTNSDNNGDNKRSGNNNGLSSMLHRLSFYKKTLKNDKNKSRDSSKYNKNNS